MLIHNHFISFTALLGLSAARAVSRDSNAQEQLAIEKQAGGLLSNLPPPPSLSKAGITNFQLIAFNENLEVAFFDEIIKNITNHVPGYLYKSAIGSELQVLEVLKTVKAVSNTPEW
jgi:hypothetical protein